MSEWQPIDTAPKDGTRIRVGHRLDPSSLKADGFAPTFGTFEGGEWVLNNYFVCVDMMLRTQPSHWLPAASDASASGILTSDIEAVAGRKDKP